MDEAKASNDPNKLLNVAQIYPNAKVAPRAKLKLKLSKKVKKGSYALTFVGTNPDGQRATKTFKVKFKQ